MNALVTINGGEAVTMTSLELVEFINSQRGEGEAVLAHSDFLKKVPQVLGESGAGNFSFTYRDVQNKERPCYRFQKREACLMAMSYSYDLQAKVFDRMTALEARQSFQIPQTLPDALRLAADLADQNAKVTAQLAIVAPKAEALDRLSEVTDGAVCLRIAAKLLQMQEKQFLQLASAEGFIFRNHYSRTWQGYADKAKAGMVELKLTTVERDDGSSKTVEQVLITRRGLANLAERIERKGGVVMPPPSTRKPPPSPTMSM